MAETARLERRFGLFLSSPQCYFLTVIDTKLCMMWKNKLCDRPTQLKTKQNIQNMPLN